MYIMFNRAWKFRIGSYIINTKNIPDVIGSFNYKQVCQGEPMAINFPGNEFYYITHIIKTFNF
jgi:hypothetical protein